MADSRSDDDTSAGVDPLIANPVLATGETGQIERPGDHQSPWVVGLLLAAFAALISGLATVALTRDDERDPSTSAAAVATSEPTSSAAVATSEPTSSIEPAPPLPTAPAAATDPVDTGEPTAPLDERLPAAGLVRVDETTWPIDAACAVHLPLAPNDAESQVSTYRFDLDGRPVVLDRRFGDRDVVEVQVSGIDAEFVSVVDIGDEGAFVATLSDDGSTFDVAVNPPTGGGTDCDDTLVTNEQGQLAFPYTRVVMSLCADAERGESAGLTSEGGRFTAVPNGDGTVTLTFRTDDTPVELVDPAASAFESGDRLGYSGIVRADGIALDITVDVTVSDATACTSAELG